jgi:hypothetical protein
MAMDDGEMEMGGQVKGATRVEETGWKFDEGRENQSEREREREGGREEQRRGSGRVAGLL